MSDELTQDEDEFDVEINNLRSAENMGYDNMKYRDRPDSGRGRSMEDDAAIFDLGDEGDDEDDKWEDDNQSKDGDHVTTEENQRDEPPG